MSVTGEKSPQIARNFWGDATYEYPKDSVFHCLEMEWNDG